ncbi:hypothetical protein SCAR479_00118 [Seiridium cardinale]|uniref:Xylanolytic transcriptional activator regulatory domain-containing protein n=1 Tax=Seiridium cardinale TaxID=138064 RepID=A0ABR2Y8L9_9PEZI
MTVPKTSPEVVNGANHTNGGLRHVQTSHPNPSLQVTADHQVKMVEAPVEEPGPGDVLLHIKTTGICGSDIHFWKAGRIGSLVVEGDCILGHEGAGLVLKCGEGVTSLKPGDRVAVEPGVPCEKCFLCREGRYNLCDDVAFAGVYPYAGTLQRYKVHPAKWLYKIPDNITWAEAALLEPLSVVLHGVKTGGLSLGKPALICGAGPIGLIALAAARASGAHPIVITDLEPKRLAFARDFIPDCITYQVDRTLSSEENATAVRRLYGNNEYAAPATVLECTGVESSIILGTPSGTSTNKTSGAEVRAKSLRDSSNGAAPRPKRAKYAAAACSRIDRLERELAALRRQVAHLASVVDKSQPARSEAQVAESACTPSQTSMAAAGVKERKEVQFVGTTRPAFALNVAKATLSVLDETSDDSSPEPNEPPIPSSQSPEMIHSSPQDPLLRMPLSAVYRLLDIFQDEIEPVYPLLDTANLRSRAAEMIKQFEEEYTLKFDGRLSQKNIHLLKIVLATAIVLESQGKTELSSQLISSFEDDALRITSPSDVDLQEAQIFAVMSIYHFHCDEELLAYRSIGISTRMVLELGLHRRRSLYENYPDLGHRSLAVRVFWCIYVLDRRWSFGTGLSFALIDHDLDPRLPEPSIDIPYFRCLVAYAKLCSEVWDAIPHYGSSDEAMPAERESLLESEIQGWFSTIPEDLQLTRTGSSPATDTTHHRQLLFQHMQTLLYLRGNYIRCLIHRHHVVSQTATLEDPGNARLVVSIAQDTIRILVNLNDTSHIYSRHQVAYNFFLLSAVSILLLAVCHAPAEFAQICRQDFFAAINLVRGFSRLSLQGRRLWSSIRGLVTRLKQIGIMNDDVAIGRKNRTRKSRKIDREGVQTYDHASAPVVSPDLNLLESNTNHEWRPTGSTNFQTTTPDMNLMGDDLMGVFDTFGGAYMDNIDHPAQTGGAQFDGNLSFLRGDADDFSDYFMGLL